MHGSELLIRGAIILDPNAPMLTADIRVKGETISEVGPGLSPGTAEVIDAAGMIAMPGLINAHTHSGQSLDRGVAPNLPLDLWLIWVVYGGIRFSADDSYTLAMAGALEMLESGCTAVLDQAWVSLDGFEEHTEAMMSAYADAGIRACLAPMIQDRDIFESMALEAAGLEAPEPFSAGADPDRLVACMSAYLDRWQGAHPRLTPFVGPSAPQRCSDELMVSLVNLARERGAGFHTHVLETRTQIVATRERYGRSVVEYLRDLGILSPTTSLAHCVWMDPSEYAAVRAAGVTVVHNPISNLRCGSGLLPLADLLEGDVSVALGADGAASNDNQNMFEAMKFAALVHTLYGPYERWPSPHAVWDMGLRGGAAALAQPLGAIRAGRRADIVLLDTARHVPVDKHSLVASLVFAEHGQSVHTVIVGGDVVVSERRATRVDRDGATTRSRALQARIHAARPDRQAVYDRHVDLLDAVHRHSMAVPTAVQRRADITTAFDAG